MNMIRLSGGNGDFSRIIPGVSVRAQRTAIRTIAYDRSHPESRPLQRDSESGGHNARIHPTGEDLLHRKTGSRPVHSTGHRGFPAASPAHVWAFRPTGQGLQTSCAYVPSYNLYARESDLRLDHHVNNKLEAEPWECLRSCFGAKPTLSAHCVISHGMYIFIYLWLVSIWGLAWFSCARGG